jgi:hypothetical protein
VAQPTRISPATEPAPDQPSRLVFVVELILLVALMFCYAGDIPPMVNEAHYLVKAKNYWQPEWCQADLFAASGKAHTTFYFLFGWPTLFVSLETTAWIGRIVGWTIMAVGLQRLCCKLLRRPLASLGVAILWIVGVEYGNLAGEWVVGGIEAKVPAYGLVLLGLSEMVDRKWQRVWPWLGAASAFHVLSGGWSVIAAMITWVMTERGREDAARLFTPPLVFGGVISLFGLVPAVALTYGASGEDATAAARIYAYFRIKHHLLPADFLFSWYLRHGLLIAATIVLSRFGSRHQGSWRRMQWFTAGAVAIAAGGMVVGMLPPFVPDLAARLLRFYWFRLTDAVVPLMFALLVMRLVVRGVATESVDRAAAARHSNESLGRRKQQLGFVLLMIATLLLANSSYRKSQLGVPPSVSNVLLGWEADATPLQQRQVDDDWRAVCRWARNSSGEDEIFLTPRHQQTFKWYAGRAEVVNWKDVPQDAANLREWYRRFREVFPRRLGTLRVTIQYDQLRQLGEQYGVRYLIVDRRVAGKHLPLVQVYPTEFESNESFAVYRLPYRTDTPESSR